jgi:uncharacterized protein YerC
MKVSAKKLTKEQYIETLDGLYTAAGSVKGRAAMKLFLRDLLSESERIMLGRRISIARRLLQKKSYSEVQNELGVGVTTISKVHRWLRDQMPGYESAVQGMEKEFTRRARKTEEKQAFARLKKKYPLHFLLFPW